jgi:hypothetical protein
MSRVKSKWLVPCKGMGAGDVILPEGGCVPTGSQDRPGSSWVLGATVV